MTQGDPDEALEQTGTKLRSYVVLSDLSEEAGYALQWAIGEHGMRFSGRGTCELIDVRALQEPSLETAMNCS